MATIAELVKKMGDADPATAHKAYRDLEELVTRASVDAALRRAAATELAAAADTRKPDSTDDKGNARKGDFMHNRETRRRAIRLLCYVAGDAEVPQLAAWMKDFHLREMARFTLQRVGGKATEALIAALDQEIGPDFRVGIVSALAQCGCPTAMGALQKTAKADPDEPVQRAAIEALADYPDPANYEIIAAAMQSECSLCRNTASRARLRLADNLAKAGEKEAARRIYRAIVGAKEDCPQKTAAEMALKAGT